MVAPGYIDVGPTLALQGVTVPRLPAAESEVKLFPVSFWAPLALETFYGKF
jgi:hypothetical protein